jgi:hypothetical protein
VRRRVVQRLPSRATQRTGPADGALMTPDAGPRCDDRDADPAASSRDRSLEAAPGIEPG